MKKVFFVLIPGGWREYQAGKSWRRQNDSLSPSVRPRILDNCCRSSRCRLWQPQKTCPSTSARTESCSCLRGDDAMVTDETDLAMPEIFPMKRTRWHYLPSCRSSEGFVVRTLRCYRTGDALMTLSSLRFETAQRSSRETAAPRTSRRCKSEGRKDVVVTAIDFIRVDFRRNVTLWRECCRRLCLWRHRPRPIISFEHVRHPPEGRNFIVVDVHPELWQGTGNNDARKSWNKETKMGISYFRITNQFRKNQASL